MNTPSHKCYLDIFCFMWFFSSCIKVMELFKQSSWICGVIFGLCGSLLLLVFHRGFPWRVWAAKQRHALTMPKYQTATDAINFYTQILFFSWIWKIRKENPPKNNTQKTGVSDRISFLETFLWDSAPWCHESPHSNCFVGWNFCTDLLPFHPVLKMVRFRFPASKRLENPLGSLWLQSNQS